MDWTTFFQDNSQSLFTLGGVFLGSLITFLVSYLNNRFQAQEKDKDRDEARREAKTQLALELTRNDIRVLEDFIDEVLKATSLLFNLGIRKELDRLSKSKWQQIIRSAIDDENGKLSLFSDLNIIASKTAHSIGGDVLSEYDHFNLQWNEYERLIIKLKAINLM